MRAALVTLVLLTGCDVVFGLDQHVQCFGHNGPSGAGLFQICLDPENVGDYPHPASISTGAGAELGDCTQIVKQSDTLGTEVCVIAAREIVLANPVQLSGERPLVLVATGDLDVRTDLDLTSRRAGAVGPGASYAGCPSVVGTSSNTDLTGSGGGAGGSFGALGGPGGRGTVDGGTPSASPAPGVVRGGCDGGNGGSGAGSGGGGAGGRSGGAVYLIAGSTLTIAAAISVSGAGGVGGGPAGGTSHTCGGGGGGGSGGLIGLDAPQILLEPTAVLIANGGGGAGGGGGGPAGTVTMPGGPGGDTMPSGSGASVPASGGTGGAPGGGAGGVGAALDANAAAGENQSTAFDAGGGGGGGGGLIDTFGDVTDQGAVRSPG
jgi:hypothetical protein